MNSEQDEQTEAQPDWREPKTLPDSLAPVMALDVDLLPAAFQEWIADISERRNCPADYAAMAAIVAAGSLIGRKLFIEPKMYDDWRVVPNLWGAIIGPPSAMKTPSLNDALRQVKRLEIAAIDDFKEAGKNAEVVEILRSATKKSQKVEVDKLVKQGKHQDAELIIRCSMEDDEPIVCKRYIVNDATVEKLGEILNQNPNGVLLERDELHGFIKTLDREDRANDRAFYLESWNGDGRYTYDRIGRGTLPIESCCVSIIGGLQPGKIRSLVKGAVDGGINDDGFLQRFQLMVFPDIVGKYTHIDRYPNTQAKNKAHDVFDALANLENHEQAVKFDNDAQQIFNDWLTELEGELRSGELHSALESHFAKYRSLVPSLALIFNTIDHPESLLTIGKTSLVRAIKLTEYLESHARRIYCLGISNDSQNAKTILKHINRRDLVDGFSAREIKRKQWSGLTEQQDVENALDLLAEYGYIFPVSTQKTHVGGRPSQLFLINPSIK